MKTVLTILLLGISASAHASESLNGFRCNTHTHTSARPNSDANETPERVVEWYRAHGYHCIVITDHEYLTEVEALNRKHAGHFLVLRGQEITQMIADLKHPGGLRHAHVNGINTDSVIMPLAPYKAATLAQTFERNVAEILRSGGLPQINHPNLAWSVRPEDLLPLAGPYLIEIWNAFPTSNNLGGTDETGARSLSTEALWDTLLSHGRIAWGVASDDVHEYRALDDRESPTPGKAWIVIQAASLTVPALMQSLREGRFYASTGIELESYSVGAAGISMKIKPTREWSPALVPTARYTTRFIGAGGQVLAEVAGRSPQYRFRGGERYVRAAIVDSDGRRAWTQPVFPTDVPLIGSSAQE
jgi:hypothetical protein